MDIDQALRYYAETVDIEEGITGLFGAIRKGGESMEQLAPCLARNPLASADVLRDLFTLALEMVDQDAALVVLECLITHPNTPSDVREQLYHGFSALVSPPLFA